MKKEPLLEIGMNLEVIEAGCDEAGRGCLAGPVFAAAVVLPPDFNSDVLNDSKKLTSKIRNELRPVIEDQALSFAVAMCTPEEIDKLNILWASVEAMHKALRKLTVDPGHILVDGNRFIQYENVPHTCVVGGDAKYMSIAAASVLAKTYRDEYMLSLHEKHPQYDWANNKGYPTKKHREAIRKYGITPYHRKSFNLIDSTTQSSPGLFS